MNSNKKRVVELVKAFINGSDCSIDAAGKLEVLLNDAFPDNSEIQDLVIEIACYRPDGGQHLFNQAEMIAILKRELPTIEGWAAQ